LDLKAEIEAAKEVQSMEDQLTLSELIELVLENSERKRGMTRKDRDWPLGPEQYIRPRRKTVDRWRRNIIANFGLWDSLMIMNLKSEKKSEPQPDPELEEKAKNSKLAKLILEAQRRSPRRGRPRKKSEPIVLPGTYIGNMYQKLGAYTCNWNDKCSNEITGGMTLEVLDKLLYGGEL